MRRITKRLTALLCAALMVATLWPAQVWAVEDVEDTESHAYYSERYEVNPLYPNLTTDDIFTADSANRENEIQVYASPKSFSAPSSAADYVKKQFKARAATISFYYTGFSKAEGPFAELEPDETKEEYTQEEWELLQEGYTHNDILRQRSFNKYFNLLIGEIFFHTFNHNASDPTGGDYMLWQWARRASFGSYENGKCEVTIYFEYYTTAEQEQAVTTNINSLMASLNLNGKSEYEKIYAIYDWICSNVTYDYPHLNDSSYFLQYTAYGALIDKTAVCQGYAILLYRMALMAGLNARLVTSDGHAWNIVQIDGLWYHVDSTWDAEASPLPWQYFLVVNPTDTDHLLDEWGASVVCLYPMSPSNYGKTPVKGNVNGDNNINVTDVAMLYAYLVTGSTGETLLTNEEFCFAADVNGDGSIDVYDLQLLYETVCGIN